MHKHDEQVDKVEDKEILFVPDTHLGHYVQEQIGREMIIWDGYCPTHSRIRDRDIIREKKDHPNAVVMSHPECPENIREVSDYLPGADGDRLADQEYADGHLQWCAGRVA